MRFGAFLLPASAAKHSELKGAKNPGANPTYYQRSLNEHARIIKQIEELGFDFVAFSEHHFHLEGLEISNNPILLGSWAAGFTKRIRLGQMATVLPARNPILVAEDLAMLDHFSEGRMFAGFARGYQSRHVTTIGQKNGAVATFATDPEYATNDARNRELFQEAYDVIKGLLNNTTFSYKGKHWQVPPDNVKWDHPKTKLLAPDMVEGDILKKIGIAPSTLQDPSTIELMVPFTLSPNTMRWAAQEGGWPIVFTPIDETLRMCLDAYHAEAVKRDPNMKWGQNVGHFRDIIVADTDEEAFNIGKDALGYIWTSWHDHFGFNEALRRPGEKGPIPNTYESMVDRGFAVVGSVDTVARKLEHMIKTYSMEMIVPWMGVGPGPVDKLLRSNELLVEKVLPKLGIKLEQRKPTFRKELTEPTWRNRPL
jgi:alkanesulfonate monooxygenase SsuD/methylene tetrahydromethanopterin reductase-like flavin-dependent oxidoreductase (luciferase family)